MQNTNRNVQGKQLNPAGHLYTNPQQQYTNYNQQDNNSDSQMNNNQRQLNPAGHLYNSPQQQYINYSNNDMPLVNNYQKRHSTGATVAIVIAVIVGILCLTGSVIFGVFIIGYMGEKNANSIIEGTSEIYEVDTEDYELAESEPEMTIETDVYNPVEEVTEEYSYDYSYNEPELSTSVSKNRFGSTRVGYIELSGDWTVDNYDDLGVMQLENTDHTQIITVSSYYLGSLNINDAEQMDEILDLLKTETESQLSEYTSVLGLDESNRTKDHENVGQVDVDRTLYERYVEYEYNSDTVMIYAYYGYDVDSQYYYSVFSMGDNIDLQKYKDSTIEAVNSYSR
jgi:hypothetical protein